MLLAVVSDLDAGGVAKARRHNRRERDRAPGFLHAAFAVRLDPFHAVAAEDLRFFLNERERFEEALVEGGIPDVEVEFTVVERDRNRDVVSDHLVRDLDHHFGDRRVDLARHDRGSGGESRKLELHPAGAGAGAHEAKILRELRKRAGHFLHDAGNGHHGVAVLEPVEEVIHRGNRFAEVFGNELVERVLVARGAGETGADGGAAHHDFKAVRAHALELLDETVKDRGVA